MQSSNIPSKIPLPFAYAAGGSYVNPIPTASQIGVVNGRASLHDGFPPLTFTPIGAGGVPPFGSDMNGILNEITAIQQWQQAGGFFTYDSAFSSIIGGYPKGAILQSADFGGLWISTAESNTTNPDTGGAGWHSLAFEGSVTVNMTSSNLTLTQIQAAYPIIIVTGTLTANSNLIFPNVFGEWIVYNQTTGSYTLTAKTAAGTGVTLTQNASTFIFGNQVSIYFADSAKVANFNGRTGTVTLNATDVVNALGYTPLNPTQFPFSAGSNGYQKLSSGLIIQWQFVNSPYGGPSNTNFIFPIAFPNMHFGCELTYQDNVGDITTPPSYTKTSLSNANFYNGSGGDTTVFIVSFGY